jgi:hypothetical protein
MKYKQLQKPLTEESVMIAVLVGYLGTKRHADGVSGLKALGWKVESFVLTDDGLIADQETP